MKEKIKTFLAICVLVLTMPYIITLLFQQNDTSPDSKHAPLSAKDTALQQPASTDDPNMDIEEYLEGVIANEIPLDFHLEAIKAQAVIARTTLTSALESGTEELPASMSREEMLTLWGQDGFETNYRVLETAIESTRGEVITYDGSRILAAYHAVSAGATRSAIDALGNEKAPYLSTVESDLDIPSTDYLNVTFLDKKDFLHKLQDACPGLKTTEDKVLDAVSIDGRDESGYVTQVTLGETTMSGENFRECLNLNSACFSLKEVEGRIRIVTKGLGHGLGLSQYGANEMAKEGMDYREILNYYYQGIAIQKDG